MILIDLQTNSILAKEEEKEKILDREGEDLDKMVTKVRKRTRDKQSEILKQIDTVEVAEIVPKKKL